MNTACLSAVISFLKRPKKYRPTHGYVMTAGTLEQDPRNLALGQLFPVEKI